MERAMKRILLFIFIVFSFFCSLGFATSKPVLNIQNWQLTNGAKVYFVSAHQIPILNIYVVFSGGSLYDGKHFGLANLTNAMIGEGSKTLTANEIAKAFDGIGAQFSKDVDRDMAVVSLRTLTAKKYLQSALNLFADVLNHPNFANKQIKRVKAQILSAIKSGQEDPASIANNTFYESIYKHFPYGHSPLGTLQSVPILTREQLLQFYKKYYVGKNAKVILVGDINRKRANEIAKQLVGKLPIGETAQRFALAAKLQKSIAQHIYFPSMQTTIVVGQVGMSRDNLDFFPLIVGNHIFGGGSLTSILYKQVRELRGLAYYAFSRFVLLRYRGPYMIALQTKASQIDEALNVVKNSLTEFIKNGPSEKQLQAAKLNLIGGFPLTFDSNSKIAEVLTNMAFYQRPLDYLDHYRDNIRRVKLSQIKSAFAHEIKLNKLAVITVGPNKN